MIRLTTIEEEVSVTIDGETFEAVERVGHVVRSWPLCRLINGKWVENPEKIGEFIRLHLLGKTYLWSGDLDEYDPETSDDNPATNVRWEAE